MILIAAYRGTSLISRLIRWQTRSIYSHIGILFTQPMIVHPPGKETKIITEGNVVEAWKGGVRLSQSLSAAHEPGTPVDLFGFKESLTQYEIRAVAEFLGAQLGKPYNYEAIFRFLTRESLSHRDQRKWFCSELAFAAFAKAGRPLLDRCAPWEIAPRDIPRSPLLKLEKHDYTA